MATREELAHLLRRATFGPRAEDLDAAERAGWDATLASLLTPATADAGAAATPPPNHGPDPAAQLGRDATREQRQQAQREGREQLVALTVWWLDRMVAADHQLREKLTFFWHGHWATSAKKVKSARLMLVQQQTLYRLGAGDFGALAHAMVRDPALIFWLDGQRSTAKAPNENLARELMELFTLGIGNYTESDVKEGARALTGWQVDRAAGTATFNRQRHDAKPKTILGRTGAFGVDEFVDLLLGHEANARFVTERLWFRFASGEPAPDDVRARLVAAFGGGRDVTAALRAVFGDPRFAATRGQLVKQPIEWAVGAMRQLGIRPASLKPEQQRQVVRTLDALGQVPLEPPSVGGWPAGAAWLTTSATQLRLRAGDLLAGLASPAALARVAAAPAAQRADALARLLVVDRFTERTRAALAAAGTGERDQRRALAIALASPEYIVH